jgi:taurine dioxygenase
MSDRISHLEIRPLTGALGAEIGGIHLAEGISEAVAAEIRQALDEYRVIFFRDQHIDDETQLELARVFGEPEVHPIRRAMGNFETLSDIVDTPDSTPDRDGWHTDVTYMSRPPGEAVLRCEVVPEFGGDTMWVDMVAIWETLSEPMQRMLEPLVAFHGTDAGFLDYIQRHLPEDVVEKVMEVVGDGARHPVVRVHPRTGKKNLFVDKAYMSRIEGLTEGESEVLQKYLIGLVENPNHQCRFRWRKGDVAVWDERTTQHFGLADHRGSHRVLRRCTIEGEEPIPAKAGVN